MTAIVGFIVTGASGGLLWRMLPKNGKPHRFATAPILDSIIPVGIIGGLAVGVSLLFSGLIAQ